MPPESRADIAQRTTDHLAGIQTGSSLPVGWDPQGLSDAFSAALVISRSGICPKELQGKPEDIMLVLWQGKEMGLSAMQSLQNIHVIYGRTGMSAALLRARAQAHPDCEIFEVTEATPEKATIEVRKRGWGESKLVTFTLNDARRAGLLKGGGNWEKWPAEMCTARATSTGVRRYFPDVIAGLPYSVEELQDMAADDRPKTGAVKVVATSKAAQIAEVAKARLEPEPKEEEEPEPAPAADQAEEATAPEAAPAEAEVLLSAEQVASLQAQATGLGIEPDEALGVVQKLGWNSLEDVPASAEVAVMTGLQRRAKAKK